MGITQAQGSPNRGIAVPVLGMYVVHMDINEAVARALQAERAIAGLTVRQLAAKSGMPERSLMRVLQAEREIKVKQVAELAAAFEIYPHEILEQAELILARQDRREDGEVIEGRFGSIGRPDIPRHVAALESDVSIEDADAQREELP
ncbi:MAG: hypothetical protein K0S43_380 [Cellulosimicrobium sp.]|jgi:transcriptional regulator with XRE-family HTH domain|nr:hypothetical protein [Cellulosimicrobium sp.]